MVIWPALRMGQYRVNDHPYHAPQFIIPIKMGYEENRILHPNNPNGKAVLFKKISKSIDFKTSTSLSLIYPEA